MTERPVDVEAVAYDDQLLNALGAGLAPSSSDPAIRALYAWRTELAAGVEDVVDAPARYGRQSTRTVRPAVGTARVNGHSNGARVNGTRLNGAASVGTPRPTGPTLADDPGETPDPPRRRGRRRAAAAAALVGLTAGLGGVAVAAADAEPGSPLWPITKVVYADRAEHRQAEADAESALEKARRALAAGRVKEAERYLDEAGRHAGDADPEHADELRDEMDAVRDKIDESDGETDPDPGDDAESAVPDPSLPSPGHGDGDSDPEDGENPEGDKGDDKGKGRDKKEGGDTVASPDGSPSASNEISMVPDGVLSTTLLFVF